VRTTTSLGLKDSRLKPQPPHVYYYNQNFSYFLDRPPFPCKRRITPSIFESQYGKWQIFFVLIWHFNNLNSPGVTSSPPKLKK